MDNEPIRLPDTQDRFSRSLCRSCVTGMRVQRSINGNIHYRRGEVALPSGRKRRLGFIAKMEYRPDPFRLLQETGSRGKLILHDAALCTARCAIPTRPPPPRQRTLRQRRLRQINKWFNSAYTIRLYSSNFWPSVR